MLEEKLKEIFDENSEDDKKAFVYYSGIDELLKRIKSLISTNQVESEKEYEIENLIFTELFYLVSVINASNDSVRKKILECKEQELKENSKNEEEINSYIDNFNQNFKLLSLKFLELNKRFNDNDEKFQDELLKSFSNTIVECLKANSNIILSDDSIKEISENLLKGLMIGFQFK